MMSNRQKVVFISMLALAGHILLASWAYGAEAIGPFLAGIMILMPFLFDEQDEPKEEETDNSTG